MLKGFHTRNWRERNPPRNIDSFVNARKSNAHLVEAVKDCSINRSSQASTTGIIMAFVLPMFTSPKRILIAEDCCFLYTNRPILSVIAPRRLVNFFSELM